MSLDDYNKLSATAKSNIMAKGGFVVSSTGGWGWPDKFFLHAEWDAIAATDQKTMIDTGDVVMITAN